MQCQRCQGLLIKDTWLEHITHSIPAYYCVNCGDITDPVIQENKRLQRELDRVQLDKRLVENLRRDVLDTLPHACSLLVDRSYFLDVV